MPVVDLAAASVLGAALRRLGYTEDALEDLLGEDAYSSETADLLVHERRLPATRLGVAARLLFLARPVPHADAVRALGEPAVRALEAAQLARGGAEVTPLARIVPVHDLLLAADVFSRGSADEHDWVAGYTPTSRLCDALTPRPRVQRVLDLGTGPGMHALLAARHARHVVATDVNPRALAYTRLNAALNGLDNVEVRQGSLFDPVGDETFDLIVCNAPFVVSPETRWIYRDTELPADELSELIVRGAAARLAPGGFATVLVSWVARDLARPDERPLGWVAGNGCDAWIFVAHEADPLDHAAGWNDHLAADPEALGAALDHWDGSLRALGIRQVSEGAVVLHRREGRVTARVDALDEDDLQMADAQLRRAFAGRAAGLQPAQLLERKLALVPAAHVVQVLKRGRVTEARVVLEEGTHPEVEIPPRLAKPLAALDGRRKPRLEPRDARYLRELLELGFLRLA